MLLQGVVLALRFGSLYAAALADELADGGVSLVVLAQRVEVGGFGVEQVGTQGVAGCLLGRFFQQIQLCFGVAGLADVQIHAHPFLNDGVAQGGQLFAGFLFTVGHGLVGTSEQFEGLLVVVLAVVKGTGFDVAGNGLFVFAFGGKGVVGLQEEVACLDVRLAVQAFLSLFHQVGRTVLCMAVAA